MKNILLILMLVLCMAIIPYTYLTIHGTNLWNVLGINIMFFSSIIKMVTIWGGCNEKLLNNRK